MDDVLYLGWLDDDGRKSVARKIEEAVARYATKFGRPATLCLVSQADYAELTGNGNGSVPGVEVRVSARCARSHFQVGAEAAESAPQAETAPAQSVVAAAPKNEQPGASDG